MQSVVLPLLPSHDGAVAAQGMPRVTRNNKYTSFEVFFMTTDF